MKFLLWKITIEPYRLAKIQWLLFKVFNIKSKRNPCGHTKSSIGYYCHQPFDLNHCNVINEGKVHRVICKCCGHRRMDSNCYINPYDDKEWIDF